jgi:N-acetyl sugar amidotransferase
MDTTDPNIAFDEDGISNHYREFKIETSRHWVGPEPDGDAFEPIAEKIKQTRAKGEYNCLIGLSGGLDSSYMLHKIVTKYGLKPLVFHVDGGWNTDLAVSNINCIVDTLGLDLYTEVINWDEMRNFQLSMFKAGVPHLDVPQDMAFIGVLYKFAEKYGIPFILNGGNVSTESVRTPVRYFYWGTDMRQIRDILRRFGTRPMDTYPFSSIFYHKIYLRYLKRVKVVKPLNYMRYIKREAEAELQAAYGWKAYPQKHFESRFTRFFEGYWLRERFGFDIRRVQYSSLILTGQMTRDEALERLQKPPLDDAAIAREFQYVADKLEIGVGELEMYLNAPKKFYWDYKNQKRVLDLGEIVLSVVAGTRRGGAY